MCRKKKRPNTSEGTAIAAMSSARVTLAVPHAPTCKQLGTQGCGGQAQHPNLCHNLPNSAKASVGAVFLLCSSCTEHEYRVSFFLILLLLWSYFSFRGTQDVDRLQNFLWNKVE